MGDEAAEVDSAEELGGKAAGGFLVGSIGVLYGQIASFTVAVFAGRQLGPELFAVVAAALTILSYVEMVLDAGMGASVIYEQERGVSRRVQTAFTVNMMIAVVVTAALAIGAPMVARFWQSSDVDVFRLVALLVLIRGGNQIPDSLLRRDLRFKRRLIVDLVRPTVRVTLAVVLVLAGLGPAGFVLAMVIAEFVGMATVWVLVRFRPTLTFDRTIARELLSYSAPVFGSRLVGQLTFNGDYFVVGARRSKEDFSAYFNAFRLPELLIGPIYYVFSSVAFPVFSAAREQGVAALRSSCLKALRYLTFLGFGVGIGLALIARDFILIAFGEEFRGAIIPMELLSVAAGFAGIGFASGDVFLAMGKARLQLWFSLGLLPVLIGGFLIAVPHGISAVALVHLVVIVPYSMFRIEVMNRVIGTRWSECFLALRPAASAVGGMVLAALPIRLATDSGVGSMLAIIGCGAVGATLGVVLGDREHAGELHALVKKVQQRLAALVMARTSVTVWHST